MTNRMIEIAANMTEKSDVRSKHGAILCSGGKVLRKSWNTSETRLNGRSCPSRHAEANLLKGLRLRRERGQVA